MTLAENSPKPAHVHNLLRHAVARAQQVNATEPLSAIRVGAHDEIYQARQPVLVGMDVDSTYCYLLEAVDITHADSPLLHLAAEAILPESGRFFKPRTGEAVVPDCLARRDTCGYKVIVSTTPSNYGPLSRFLVPSSGPDGGPGAVSRKSTCFIKVPAPGIRAPS